MASTTSTCTATNSTGPATRDLDVELAAFDPSMPRARRILLLGTHGQFNIGDELLLETFLDQLGPHHRFAVNSYAPERTAAELSERYEVDVFDTAGDRMSLLRHLLRSDAVLFAGGSIVKELYASVGRWKYATLMMVLAIVVTARLARRPIAMVGVGVGPIETRFGRLLAGIVLRLVSLVAVRDRASLQMCHRLGIDGHRVAQIPDTVFANDPSVFAPVGPTASAERAGHGPLRIALNLNRDIANGDRWEEFLGELTDAIDRVAATRPIEVHALPMQSEFKDDDDLSVLREFLADRSNWNPVVHETVDHRDVGGVIADCDVLVSERLHAIVIASILGCSSVGLLYDVKVVELADQLGIADRSADINVPVDSARLAEQIVSAADSGEGERLRCRAAEMRTDVLAHFARLQRWLESPKSS